MMYDRGNFLLSHLLNTITWEFKETLAGCRIKIFRPFFLLHCINRAENFVEGVVRGKDGEMLRKLEIDLPLGCLYR